METCVMRSTLPHCFSSFTYFDRKSLVNDAMEAGVEEICDHKRVHRHGPPESAEVWPEGAGNDEERWGTVTQDSYPAPLTDPATKSSGRRRELVKKFIGLEVLEETLNAIGADPPPRPASPSEYSEKYCDAKFVPFMDRTEYDTRKHLKYPLHGGAAVQSYYKSLLDGGTLKARAEISNFNEPFRRSCSFTTPPDIAFREPTGGF